MKEECPDCLGCGDIAECRCKRLCGRHESECPTWRERECPRCEGTGEVDIEEEEAAE